jgi:hypothetical protein
MDEQAASEFTQSLAIILGAYGDACQKVTALVSALEEHDPAFFGKYESHLSRLEKDEQQDKLGTQAALALERLQGLLEK